MVLRKSICQLVVGLFLLYQASVQAFVDSGPGPCAEGRPCVDHFWEIAAEGDVIGGSRITTEGFEDQRIHFAFGEATLGYTQLLGWDRDCGLSADIGYAYNRIGWEQNPSFHQQNFNNLILDLGGFSAHLPGWIWKVNFGFQFDLDHFEVAKRTLYSFTLWGRYSLSPCLGVHLGVIATTGLDKDKAWPVVGFDYAWTDRIKINLVYPVDLSASYLIDPHWSVGIAQRIFWTRHRTGADEPLSRALVEYRNTGTEARLVFLSLPGIALSIHGGWAWGQDLIIGNQNGDDNTHYKFDGAPYGGLDISLKF